MNHVPDIFENSDTSNCNYVIPESFLDDNSHILKDNLSIISCNIRSFSKNHPYFLGFLTNCKHDFDIIALTETWENTDDNPLFHIAGYYVHHVHRDAQKGGGVALFIKEGIISELQHDMCLINQDYESLGIKIKTNNTANWITILNLYRPPNGNKTNFSSYVEQLINNHSLDRNDTFIVGDLNLCLLKENYCDGVSNFINLMRSFNFQPLITRPTRIDNNGTLSILDQIWTNTNSSLASGIFISKMTSDHFPVYSILTSQSYSLREYITIKFRDMSHDNINNFNNQLRINQLDNTTTDANNIDKRTEDFLDKLNKIYERCIPLKTKVISPKRYNSPWLTKALLKSIAVKHQMYRRHIRGLISRDDYNRYCNLLKLLLRTSRKNYFSNRFEHFRNDVSNTWKLINSTVRPRKKKNSSKPEKIIYNDTTISDKVQIADALNSHFCTVGQKLRDALPNQAHNFRNYLPPPSVSSIFLAPSSPDEVKSIILSLKNKKINIHSIPTKLYKINADILSSPISSIFNAILINGIYPSRLKIACVTSLFKSGCTENLNNYRPISSLPILNLIFEKLLYKRLLNFLESKNFFSKHQFGFRKGRQTIDAINELLNKVYECYNKKKIFGCCFC